MRAVHSRQSGRSTTADEPRRPTTAPAARITTLLHERDPKLEQLLRERELPMPSEIRLPRGYGELVTAPLEEALASQLARRHILGLGKK